MGSSRNSTVTQCSICSVRSRLLKRSRALNKTLRRNQRKALAATICESLRDWKQVIDDCCYHYAGGDDVVDTSDDRADDVDDDLRGPVDPYCGCRFVQP